MKKRPNLIQRWSRYWRERRRRRDILREARGLLESLDWAKDAYRLKNWEVLDFLAGFGCAHMQALVKARRGAEMLARAVMETAEERPRPAHDPRLN